MKEKPLFFMAVGYHKTEDTEAENLIEYICDDFSMMDLVNVALWAVIANNLRPWIGILSYHSFGKL